MISFTVYKGSPDGNPVKATTTKPSELTGDQVLLKVLASGVCGTDLHQRNRDIVLGHEGVGAVQAIGPDVKNLTIGQRVGWGFQTGSCGLCKQCLTGDETYCPGRQMYGHRATADQGSFATQAIWHEAFLHPIPDAITSEDAAPLQCGGATVFTALLGVKPTDTVGVIGVGGLGHLAIQFANKMGCRVVVISSSDRKKEEAERLGGHRFVATNNLQKDAGAAAPKGDQDVWQLDRLLVTTSALPDWEVIMPMMAVRSRIFPLSVGGKNLVIPYAPVLQRGVVIQSALVATRAVHQDMLAFAAHHGVKPVIELFPLNEVGAKEAMDRLEKGQIHFRAVLVPEESEKHKI